MPMNISELIETSTALKVQWTDGGRSRFPYVWLRDNCTCADCGTTVTGARFLRLTDIPADVHPAESRLDDTGHVAIRWSGSGHYSLYDPGWLAEHCAEMSRVRRSKPTTWDRHIGEALPHFNYTELAHSETAPISLIEELFRTGFVFIKQVPVTAPAIVETGGFARGDQIAELRDGFRHLAGGQP